MIRLCTELLQRLQFLALVSIHILACQGHNWSKEGAHLRTFKLFQRLYKYCPGQDTFQPVQAMPPHLPNQICRALDSLHLVNTAGMLSQFSYLS